MKRLQSIHLVTTTNRAASYLRSSRFLRRLSRGGDARCLQLCIATVNLLQLVVHSVRNHTAFNISLTTPGLGNIPRNRGTISISAYKFRSAEPTFSSREYLELMDVQYVAANIRGYFTRQNRVETLWDRMGIREKPWPKNILADHQRLRNFIFL